MIAHPGSSWVALKRVDALLSLSHQKAAQEFIKTHPGVHFLSTCASQRDAVLEYASTEEGYFNGLLLVSSRLALKRHLENVSLEKTV